MKRIRSATAAGVLAGATVLGGVGLAGATTGGTDEDVTEGQDLLAEATDDRSTGEAEAPAAPDLLDQAAEVARTALAERFAGAAAHGGDDEAHAGSEAMGGSTDSETAEVEGHHAHGAHVSDVARTAEPGPEHGATVSGAAREHGEHQRDQRPAGLPEDEVGEAPADEGTSGDETAEDETADRSAPTAAEDGRARADAARGG